MVDGIESGAHPEFRLLSLVPLGHGTQVTYNAGIHFRRLGTDGANGLFAHQITVIGANAEGG